jgi:hypothetical protein
LYQSQIVQRFRENRPVRERKERRRRACGPEVLFIPKALVPDDEALKQWINKGIDESYLMTAMKQLNWKSP